MPTTPVYGWQYPNRYTDPLTYPVVSGERALRQIEETVAGAVSSLQADIASIEAVLAAVQPGQVVARLRRSLSATIANNAVIPFDVEDFDDLSGHSTSTNPSRYTPPLAGRWLVTVTARHQAISAGAALGLRLLKNGVQIQPEDTDSANSSPSAGTGLSVTDVIECNGTSDYIEASIGNNQAVAVNCQNSIMVITYGGPIP